MPTCRTRTPITTPKRIAAVATRIADLSEDLSGNGFLTYAEQAKELNRRGERTARGNLWSAQSLYIACRTAGRRRMTSRETHELVGGRWRQSMRGKVLELRSYGVTRYDDLAAALNQEGIATRLGRAWTKQAVFRLMRDIGLPTGKRGRRRRDE